MLGGQSKYLGYHKGHLPPLIISIIKDDDVINI